MMLRFSDGVNIDTSGEYRAVRLRDGWYVVGHGMSSPEPDQATAEAYAKELRDLDLGRINSVQFVRK